MKNDEVKTLVKPQQIDTGMHSNNNDNELYFFETYG